MLVYASRMYIFKGYIKLKCFLCFFFVFLCISFAGGDYLAAYIFKIPFKRKGIFHIVNECISQKILIVQWELQQEGVT